MDEAGVPNPPCPDWSDTADLKHGAGIDEMDKRKYEDDADRGAMWDFMTSVLKYWVEEFDVDGFRCDFAHWLPLPSGTRRLRLSNQSSRRLFPLERFISA